jgi:hypothetical protein
VFRQLRQLFRLFRLVRSFLLRPYVPLALQSRLSFLLAPRFPLRRRALLAPVLRHPRFRVRLPLAWFCL